jgi:hypothetical protein
MELHECFQLLDRSIRSSNAYRDRSKHTITAQPAPVPNDDRCRLVTSISLFVSDILGMISPNRAGASNPGQK